MNTANDTIILENDVLAGLLLAAMLHGQSHRKKKDEFFYVALNVVEQLPKDVRIGKEVVMNTEAFDKLRCTEGDK
ncbi:MAG: hypothetical protein LBU11_12525 [Zoogloeaceae bacterium]|jgi:hypothetical protein|nr:hypothetical protein [Zoogloeaceae bacterium]